MAEHAHGECFPQTPRSAILRVRSLDPVERSRSLEVIATRYWKATYKYVRLRWRKRPSEAEEVTQEFFLRAIDKGTFVAYDPQRGRFRTFVRVCIDRFVVDLAREHCAKKRGGGMLLLPWDFAVAEEELEDAEIDIVDPDALFEAEWARSLLQASVESLRAACTGKGKEEHFRAFELFHLGDAEPPSYEAIAAALRISVKDVTNRLAYARREFRAVVLDALRKCTGSEREMQEEARIALGLRF